MEIDENNDTKQIMNDLKKKSIQDVILSIRNLQQILDSIEKFRAYSELSEKNKQSILEQLKILHEELTLKYQKIEELQKFHIKTCENLHSNLLQFKNKTIKETNKIESANKLIDKINLMRKISTILLSSQIPETLNESVLTMKMLRDLQCKRDIHFYKRSSRKEVPVSEIEVMEIVEISSDCSD